MKNNFKIGFFGKLPNYADFIKYNASNDEVLDFDEWIQQGLIIAEERLQSEWSEAYKLMPMYCFLFPSEDSKNLLIGNLHSSFDLSGRKYPFMVSLNIENFDVTENNIYHLPLIYKEFLDKSELFIHNAFDINIFENLTLQFDQIDYNLDNSRDSIIQRYDEFLLSTNYEEFWNQIGSSSENSSKYLLFKNLNDILSPFRNQDISNLSLGLRFPLSNGDKHYFETAFWIHTSMQICNKFNFVPFVFWSTQVPYCVLYFKKPSASDFTSLIKPEMDWDTICVLDREGNRENLLDNIPNEYKSIFQIPNLTLSGFLQELKTIDTGEPA